MSTATRVSPPRVDPQIERLLRQLAAAVPRLTPQRHSLLAEARDGLVDAVDSYRRRGHDPGDAVRLAIAEFGDPRLVGVSFAERGLGPTVRRTGLILGIGYLVILVAWALLESWAPTTMPGLDRLEPPQAGAKSSFKVIGALLFVLVAVTLVLLRRSARRRGDLRRLAAVVGVVGLLAVVVTWTASYQLQPWTIVESPWTSWRAAVELLSAGLTAVIAVSSGRCLAVGLRLRPESPRSTR